MKRPGAWLSVALVQAAAAQTAAPGAGSACDARGFTTTAPGAYRIAFAPRPAPLATGRHLALELRLCQAASEVRSLQVDADMPAHRHGMNYRASVKALGPGRWQAEGLMFHMPGRWRLIVDLDTAAGPQRLTHEFDLP